MNQDSTTPNGQAEPTPPHAGTLAGEDANAQATSKAQELAMSVPTATPEIAAEPEPAEPKPADPEPPAPERRIWRILEPEVKRLPTPMQDLLQRLPLDERIDYLLQHYSELSLFRTPAAVPASPTPGERSQDWPAATPHAPAPNGRRLYENF